MALELNKIIGYTIVIAVGFILLWIGPNQIFGAHKLTDSIVNSTVGNLTNQNNTKVDEKGIILKSKEYFTNLTASWERAASSGTNLCRINQTLKPSVGNGEKGYNFKINKTENQKLSFQYQDPVQGLSFEKELVSINDVYIIQDLDGYLDTHSIQELLSLAEQQKSPSKLSIITIRKKFMESNYVAEEIKGTNSTLSLYTDQVLNPSYYYDADSKSLSSKYIWKTTIKSGKNIILIDTEHNWFGGNLETDKTAEIEKLPICP
jgi:hypothetical protein